MSAPTRHHLLYSSLILLVLVDLLALASFVFNQLLAVPFWQAIGLSALLALPITMLVLPIVDSLLGGQKPSEGNRFLGDKIPGMGQ